MSGPVVFLDISFNNGPPKRLVIQLFAKPIEAVENFRALCAGDKGFGKTTEKPLHYKGCRFYRVFSGIAVEGGDFENQDGTGGESIYGGTFPVENMHRSHSERGIILMADHGRPNRIGSQFYICLSHYPTIDGFNVGVGKVLEGLEALEKFDQLVTSSLKPLGRVEITDCGEVSKDVVIISDKPSPGFVFAMEATKIRKEEYVAKLLKDNDSKKYESSDEKLEATLKNDLLVTNGNDREVTSEKPSSSNPHQHSDDLIVNQTK